MYKGKILMFMIFEMVSMHVLSFHTSILMLNYPLTIKRELIFNTNMNVLKNFNNPVNPTSGPLTLYMNVETRNEGLTLLSFLQRSWKAFCSAVMIVFLSFGVPKLAWAAKKVQANAIKPIEKTSSEIFKDKLKAFFKVILQGSYAKRSLKNMKVGDSRSGTRLLLNAISSSALFLVIGTFAFVIFKGEERNRLSRLKFEVNRVKEYKENMYFEAVEKIVNKLNQPNLKGSTKANLSRQLKELDPNGVIQKFLKEGGERPDMSEITNLLPQRSDDMKSSGSKKPSGVDSKDRMKKKVSGDQPSSTTKVLEELSSSLEDALSDSMRRKLVNHLKNRIEGISNVDKRNVALKKISDKMGDDEYWTNYYENNLK